MSRTLHPDTTMIRGRARGSSPFRRCGVVWPPTPDKGLPARKLPWREEPVSRFTPAQLQFLLDSAELVIEQNGEPPTPVVAEPSRLEAVPPAPAPEPSDGAAELLDATTDPELATLAPELAPAEELTDLDAESAAAGEAADEAEAEPTADATATRRHRSHGKGGKK